MCWPHCSLVPHDAKQISFMLSLNYATHVYLSVLLARSSSLLAADPAVVHPDLKLVGPVSPTASFPHLIRSQSKGWSTSRCSSIFGPKGNVGAVIRGNHQCPSSDRWGSKGGYPRTPNADEERSASSIPSTLRLCQRINLLKRPAGLLKGIMRWLSHLCGASETLLLTCLSIVRHSLAV